MVAVRQLRATHLTYLGTFPFNCFCVLSRLAELRPVPQGGRLTQERLKAGGQVLCIFPKNSLCGVQNEQEAFANPANISNTSYKSVSLIPRTNALLLVFAPEISPKLHACLGTSRLNTKTD